jgi:hypothetical protein
MPSSYFSKTFTTPTNNKIYTLSTWIKKSSNSGYPNIISAGTRDCIRFEGTGSKLRFLFNELSSGDLLTTQVFRDVSAWYHLVFAIDTTQATASNRVKIYVNGSQITAFDTATYPAQNYSNLINSAIEHRIGSDTFGYGENFDGSMASYYFIDGQALDASYFGETDATTGIWKPKSYSGTYGTNGFFLKFENSASLGTDSSGNGNNFTVNGTPTQTVDTPSNVFCTLNAIQNGNGTTSSLSNGNTTAGTNDNRGVAGTLGVNKGKWYWEVKNVGTQTNQRFGVSNRANEQDGDASPTGDTANVRSYVGLNYQKNYSASSGTTNNSFIGTNGTVFAFALDLDNGTMGRYVNGTLISTDTTLPSDNSVTFFPFTFVTFNNGNWNQAQFNFGNGVFGTTAISSPYSDGAGLGKFQYAVPAGYYSLCTKNINSQG